MSDIFPWWLWLCNLGSLTNEIIGHGVTRIDLVELHRDQAMVDFARFDILRGNDTRRGLIVESQYRVHGVQK